MKTLGVLWSSVTDEFSFKPRKPEDITDFTKRTFLKLLATVFDPLGMATPVIVLGRQILQDIWIGGYDWDDPLLDSINARIKKWLQQLSDLSNVTVPRCLQEQREDN